MIGEFSINYTGENFRVRISDTLSDAALVLFGVIHGFTLEPILYDIFIDSPLSRMKLSKECFADNLKFVADVKYNNNNNNNS